MPSDPKKRKKPAVGIPASSERRPKANHKDAPEGETAPQIGEILNNFGDGFIVTDRDWRIKFANNACEELLTAGIYTSALSPGDNLLEKLEHVVEAKPIKLLRAAAAELRPASFEIQYGRRKRWLEIRLFPSPDLLSICVRNIDASKRAERNAKFISSLSQRLALSREPDSILRETTEAIGRYLEADYCGFGNLLDEGARVSVTRDWSRDGLASWVGVHPTSGIGVPEIWANLPRSILVWDDIARLMRRETTQDARSAVPIRSLLSVPFLREDRCQAILAVACEAPRNWLPDEVKLLEDCLGRVWPAIEQLRSQREHRQRELMQMLPVPCYGVDAEGRLTFFNDAAAKLWGRKPELGKDSWGGSMLLTALDGTPVPLIRTPIVRAMRERRRGRGEELFVVRPDGSRRRIVPYPEPVLDEQGNCLGAINVVMDVTEERDAHERVSKAADRLNLAIDAANLGDWTWDLATDRMTLGPRTCEIYGFTSDPGLTRTELRELVHADDRERVRDTLRIAVEQRSDYDIEYRVVRPDGSLCWVAAKGRGVSRPDGGISGMVGMVQDITTRKRQVGELELLTRRTEEQTRLYDAILSNISDLAYAFDPAGRFIFANKPLLELLGRRADDVVGKNCFELGYPPELAARLQSELRQVVETGHTVRGEIMFTDAAGKTDYHEYIYNPIRDADQGVVAVVGSTRLVTEWRVAEQSLREARSQLEATLSAAEIGTWRIDISNNRLKIDRNTAALFGLSPEQTEGPLKNYLALIHPDDRPRMVAAVTAAFAGGEFDGDCRFLLPSGEVRWFTARGKVQTDPAGKPLHFPGVLIDITERRRTEAMGEGQRNVLQLIAEDAPLGRILGALVQTVERGASAKVFGGVMLLNDGKLNVGAAPTLPAAFTAAIDGIGVGPATGCCGAAAWSKKPVYAPDLANETRWGSTGIFLSHGLRACWSSPILSSQGEVLGTFAMYYPEPREPSEMERGIADLATRTAAIAIENKRASAALRQSENHLRIAVETARLGSWEWDAATGEVQSSARCKANFGVSPDVKSFGEQDYASLIHPDDAERVAELTLAAAASSEIYEMEYRVVWPDGTLHWIVESGRGLRDENGRVIKVVGVTYDLTERKLAEEGLRRSEAQLRLVTDNAPVLLVRLDRRQHFTFVNRAYAEHFGLPPGQIVSRPVADILGRAAYESLKPRIEMALAGERVEFELAYPYSGAGDRWLRVIYVPERDQDGAVTGLLGVISDISGSKQAEFELKRARDEALEASRAKDDFLAALSHELRTPLNPVLLLASDAAGNPDLPDAIRADFELVRKNVDLEARLIDDLLDLTRITRGKLLLDKKTCDLHEVLRDAVKNIEPDLSIKGLALSSILNAENHLIIGDPVRLQQVFWNILKNAVKFTPAGGAILLEAVLSEKADTVVVRVTDTGIGMTPGEIARAFQAFAQGDHATAGSGSHRFGGLGLGLAISKMLVDLHGGQIHAASDGLGHGSVFLVELPLHLPSGFSAAAPLPGKSGSVRTNTAPPLGFPASGGKESGPAAYRTILLVEDHVPTRQILGRLLYTRGFDVTPVSSSAEALHVCTQGRFSLIISDVGLPDGNGYELMTRLKAIDPALVGIALSGYGMEDDLARSLAAGFSAHLVKPVTIGMLESAIHLLPRSSAETSAFPPS